MAKHDYHIDFSNRYFTKAQHYMPGGVNSPVRAFKAVGGTPIFVDHASGAELTDVDGNTYIDYVGSWGPMIAGHAHPTVIAAAQQAMTKGLSFGAPCEAEIKLAATICDIMPNIEQIRMVNSGTEATMSAIRLARGVTGRDKIIKFAGCYHGHADSLLVQAGSGTLTFGTPSSPGVTAATAEDTLVANYNDIASVERLFEKHAPQIAAVIIEPIAGNMNMVLPIAGFLDGLRELCTHYGALLICDEVMTGFRVALGGAQQLYNVQPDLTTLGKVIGGGLPVGAFGGRKAIMEQLSPNGPIYQAGTLSGNPIAMAAGLATIQLVQQPSFHTKLSETTEKLINGILSRAKHHHVPLTANYAAGMFGLFFSQDEKITHFDQVMQCNQNQFKSFFHHLLKQGVYCAPSAFEAGFISAAHQAQHIAKTLDAVEVAFSKLALKAA